MRWYHAVLTGIVSLATVVAGWAAEGPKHGKLSAVPFTAVKLEDGFWAPRIRTNREKSLPHNFRWCEETGRISNFVKAGRGEGKFEGIYFNDSDVYKVLEGASYSLADRPDPALDKTVDEVIAKIASAQQPDGYLNSYYTLAERGKRWSNLKDMHELYCAGHMIEAAVAHFRATGKRSFLDVAVRYADLIDRTFGPGKQAGICGHEEIELALVKLYQATGEKRWLELARVMIDRRGNAAERKTWGPYCQDHVPVREQREIVGHAVRAMYLYSGVADVASYTGDAGLIATMDYIWRDVVLKKMYVTGGIGARHEGEAFGDAYELPNDQAYCETCAAIGLCFWAHRLNLMHGDAQYADVVERTLYNGILSGIALDGQHFFYVNPLASSGGHHRQPFYGCACCPSNVVRLVPSVPGYAYAVSDEGIVVNLYAAGTATVDFRGMKVKLTQQTLYPWDGKVQIKVEPEKPAEFEIALRIPGWVREKVTSEVKSAATSGPQARTRHEKGYRRLLRNWQVGDEISLELPMPVQRIEAHARVKADAGRVAVQRGPVVYCFEAVDNGGSVRDIVLAKDAKFVVERRSDLLGGVHTITAQTRQGKMVTAVPYYAWDHRAAGEMAVWVRQDGKSRQGRLDDPAWEGKLYRALDPASLGASEPPTLEDQTRAKASHCQGPNDLGALNDGAEPRDSCDHNIPRFTWWDHRGTKEWVEYEFETPQKLSTTQVYWFDDARIGRHCRAPKAWRLLYKEGDAWKPVRTTSPYGTEIDRYNRVTFEPIETRAVRIEAELNAPWSAGILEWKVK